MIYSIEGIDVDFPFDAYGPQIQYMKQVIRALKTGENALLESPTGNIPQLCPYLYIRYIQNIQIHINVTELSGGPICTLCSMRDCVNIGLCIRCV
jgi:hypothetical protein